tara:strand:+ start:41 stop:310 length:270 start_codon:yes stop_codon:yes gene_type:complete
MGYELLYDIVKGLPRETQWRDLPRMAEDEIRGLRGSDLAGGLLGLYIKNRLPDSLNIDKAGIGWSPNDSSNYRFEYRPGDIKLKGSWSF